MGDVKVTVTVAIEGPISPVISVSTDNGRVRLGQGQDFILIDTAAVPALIEALQAAAKET